MLSLSKSEKLRLTLFIIFIGFFLGNIVAPWTQTLLLMGGICVTASVVWRRFFLFLPAVLLFSMSYTGWRLDHQFLNDVLPSFHGEEVTLEGFVSGFPDRREEKTLLPITVEKIMEKEGRETRLGVVLLHAPSSYELNYGDLLKIDGKLLPPRNFDTFDYREYLKRFHIQTILQHPSRIEILEKRTHGNALLRTAEKTRNKLASNLDSSLPQPHSRIAMGILLGIKNELPEWTQNDFKRSGLQHLLVVSGFNVAVVILIISILFKRLGRRIVFVGNLFAILFFVAMTGAEAPVIRAALMGGITGWAVALGRFSETRNLVFLSAVLIGLWNPRIVLSDIGFWLSATATLGIVLGTPLLEKRLSFLPEKFGCRTILAVTIVAQISVFPILSLTFGTFPYAGFLSNLLAEPLIPIGMGFSFLASLTGPFSEIIAKIVSIPAFLVLETLLHIAQIFGKIPPLKVAPLIGYLGLVGIFSFFLWGSFRRPTPIS